MKKGIILAMILLLVGFFVGFMANSKTTIVYESDCPREISFGGHTMKAEITVPAVDENKTGLEAMLYVEIVPGKGRIFANIDRMLFEEDTQNSFRTARDVAAEKTGIDVSGYDIIYTIETDATSIEGPSAGAAATVATISALTGKDIKDGVLITGAINHDGTIGRVSNVLEKAIAAGKSGIRTMLVPLTQGSIDKFETKRYCEDIGTSSICQNEDIPKTTSISEVAGLEVVEVVTIDDALEYLLDTD
ncbi:MAG: hypothetical protein GXO64_01290 [Candidatus Micrarchaeota archaeon]|nr:hypothetical protein [Candidatus Micrarchaeota archaeon]